MTTSDHGKLDISAPSDREVIFKRVVDAPKALVWDAFTKPELLKRWMNGPEECTMPVCEVDLKVGGRLYFVWQYGDFIRGLNCTYLEVVPGTRLSYSEDRTDDGIPGDAVVTTTFEEADGKTTVTMSMLFHTAEMRAEALASGQGEGFEMGFDRLVRILTERA